MFKRGVVAALVASFMLQVSPALAAPTLDSEKADSKPKVESKVKDDSKVKSKVKVDKPAVPSLTVENRLELAESLRVQAHSKELKEFNKYLKEAKKNGKGGKKAKITPSAQTPTEQIEELELKIQDTDSKVIESMDRLEKINKQVANGKKKIARIKQEVAEAEEAYEKATEVASSRLQGMQVLGGANRSMLIVEALLSSRGFTDFLDRTTALATIVESDALIIESLEEKEAKIKDKKLELEIELSNLVVKQEEAKSENAKIQKEKKSIEKELKRVQEIQKIVFDNMAKAEKARLKRIEKAKLKAEKERIANLDKTLVDLFPETAITDLDDVITLTGTPNVDPVKATAVISEMHKYLGIPYVWGGTTPSGFDCSGLMQYVYRMFGVELPRVARQQQDVGINIPLSEIQPGDMLFRHDPATHVAIYIGNGEYLHAPRTGDVIKISKYNPSWWTSATRVLFATDATQDYR